MYPSGQQEEKMMWTLNKCRLVYNDMLEGLNKQKKPNRYELQAMLPKFKEQHPELKGVHSNVLQYEPYRLFSALRGLAQSKEKGRKVGRLRFKGKGRFKTFTYNQSGFKVISTGKRCQRLHLSKIGEIPIRVHRNLRGSIKQVTIKRYPSGKWFAMMNCELQEKLKPTRNRKKIGIDVGLNSLVHDSDGNRTDHPRCLNKSLKMLKKAQRTHSKKKKGSANRNRQRIIVARIHERVVNQRDDFLHKLSRHYVNSYGLIALEKFNITNMVKNHHLAKSIMDASWSRLIQMTEYKAESAGVRVVRVSARNTTQRCSQCGSMVKKSLSVRMHKCPTCGFIADRDYNSSLEILNRALGREPPESTPVEIGPLLMGKPGRGSRNPLPQNPSGFREG